MTFELREKLQELLPSLRTAIELISDMHPDTAPIFDLVDEIWQLRTGMSILTGIGLLSSTETIANPAPQQEPSTSFVSPGDAAIFAEINELWSPYHEITMEDVKIDDGKGSQQRIWHIAIPCIEYSWGIATSPGEILRGLKTSIVIYDNVQEERQNSPVTKEAYSLAGEHNKDVEKHNEAVKERGGSPGEYCFEVTIEVHGLRWLVGIPVGESKWAGTPDELLQAVKDQISYLEEKKDEIMLLLGG